MPTSCVLSLHCHNELYPGHSLGLTLTIGASFWRNWFIWQYCQSLKIHSINSCSCVEPTRSTFVADTSSTKMSISSRHKQQILANCDISICDSKIQVSSVEKLLGATISNTLCWDAHIEQLIKKCNSYLFLLLRIKVFYLEGTEYFLTFYLILISVVLSGVTVVLHWKINL